MRTLLALLLALPVFAQTGVIASIEPRQLPYFGGQFVIHGQNLSIQCTLPHGHCTQLRVELDGHRSHLTVSERSPDRIVVSVGPREIGPATVRVFREDRTELVSFDGIHFSGAPETEAVLVPLIMAERAGAFGSRWATSFTGWNGLALLDPIRTSGTPAIVVRQDRRLPDLDSLHLRVRDLNREDTSWGTEVPIVRERDFRLDTIHLLDIPTDRRYRVSLRIYNLAPIEAARNPADYVTEVMPFDPCCGPAFPQQRPVRVGAPSINARDDGWLSWGTPGYLELNDFLADWTDVTSQARTVRITIRHLFLWDDPTPPLFWAFASITHNETQHVTLVTPSERR